MLTTIDVMTKLREATTEHHKRAEGHRFQKSLVKGELPEAGYVAWLGQMLLVHRALEQELDALASRCPEVATVLGDDWRKEERLLTDLVHLGASPLVTPNAATIGLIEQIREIGARGRSLLGMFYVLEGSTNGGVFIARAVRHAYGLNGDGTRYLDPYGGMQRERWAGFKARMADLDLSGDDADAMVAAAQSMFDGITAVSEDLATNA